MALFRQRVEEDKRRTEKKHTTICLDEIPTYKVLISTHQKGRSVALMPFFKRQGREGENL
jgi:hypothetical protein